MLLHQILRCRPKSIFPIQLTTTRSMGGGPRTFPGGLNKWQYKRMHEKLAKEKERKLLHQEKQLYQARLRSEIRARQDNHEPLQQQTNPGNYLAMSSKDHIKALADRFMKQGAEDLWNEDDGPIRLEERLRLVERPLNLRKIVNGGRSALKQLDSFEHKREYSTFADGFDVKGLNYLSFYRLIDKNQKMHYRKIMKWSSDDEDDIQYSEGNDLIGKNLKISGFRSRIDGKEKGERRLRVGETREKMMSGAALKNFDKKKVRRAPRGWYENEEDFKLMGQIQEMQEDTKNRINVKGEVKEESVLTPRRLEFPPTMGKYIHRLGRTGHEGKDGKGILLLAPWEEFFMEELRGLPLEKHQAPDIVDSNMKQKVKDSIRIIDTSIKEVAYHAWLGYYNSISDIRRDKTLLADLATRFAQSIGLEKPPSLYIKSAFKMGLKNVPGIRIRK